MISTFLSAILATVGSADYAKADTVTKQDYCSSVNGLAALQLSDQTRIVFPGDVAFDNDTLRWTSFHQPNFSMVIYAFDCGIPFLASSGAHGFSTTFGALQNGLQIDMSAFRDVSVDAVASAVTVGGGVRFMDVIDPVYAAGKEINLGTDACVGMLSPSLAGGVGRYSGLHGMIGDQLLSLRVITANGSIVTASASENPELFWAMKGAGNAFGIVSEATYQIFDLTSQYVVNADLTFAANESAQLIDYFASFGDMTPPELAPMLWGAYNSDLGDVALYVNLVYAGNESGIAPFLDSLLANTHPLQQSVSTVPWNELLYTQFYTAFPTPQSYCEGYGVLHSVFGGAIKSYDKSDWLSFISDFRDFISNHTGAQSSVFFIEQFSKKKVLDIPDSSASYPWRDITAHLLWNYAWVDASLEAPIDDFGKQVRDKLQSSSGFNVSQIYLNYGHGDEAPETLYSAQNLPRLRQLKAVWDPDNLFQFDHSIF